MSIYTSICLCHTYGLPWQINGKESTCQCRCGFDGDVGSIPGLGRSLREGNGNPVQYACLGNPMDRGAWRATVHKVAKSQTQLNNFTFTFYMHSTLAFLLYLLALCFSKDLITF